MKYIKSKWGWLLLGVAFTCILWFCYVILEASSVQAKDLSDIPIRPRPEEPKPLFTTTQTIPTKMKGRLIIFHQGPSRCSLYVNEEGFGKGAAAMDCFNHYGWAPNKAKNMLEIIAVYPTEGAVD